MIEIVPATPAHVGTIAARMREWDRIEARAFGHSPKQALRVGLNASLWALTAKVDGRPEAMIGLTPVSMIEGRGIPWMLGTDAVYGQARGIARMMRQVVSQMRADCPRLENWVAVGNVRARSFLRHVGFGFDDEPLDVGGVDMLRFFSRPSI